MNINAQKLIEKYRFSLELDDVERVLTHASYQYQDSEYRKENKDLVVYGNKVSRAMVAVFSYVNHISSDAGELSILVSSAYSLLVKSVYEKYDLVSYEMIAAGEEGNVHHDTASKLLALYYKNCGFIETYSWLISLLRSVCKNDNHDYKTILQEYAQKRKLVMDYKIIGVDGPDNNPKYTCELTVGRERVIENGRSKKEAQKAVAKKYVLGHQIPVISDAKIQQGFVDNKIVLTSDRVAQLKRISETLQIKPDELPLEYLNAAFVHKSIQNDQGLKGIYVDNSVLTVIGSELFPIYVLDYLFSSENYKYIDAIRVATGYVNSDTLREALPDSWINNLVALSSVKKDNAAGLGNVKKEIFHSILAVLVLYGVQKSVQKSELRAIAIVKVYLKTVKEHRKADCVTTLNEVSELLNLQIKRDFNQQKDSLDHEPIFAGTIHCWNENISLKKYDEGSNKGKAINKAARQILIELLELNDGNAQIKKIILRELEPEAYYKLLAEERILEQEKNEISEIITKEMVMETLKKREDNDFDDMEISFLRNLCI